MDGPAPASSARGEWREGWPLVMTAAIGIAVVGIHYHVVGAMIRPLGQAYGWSRGEIAFALTLSSLIGPFANVAVGLLADRIGPRPVVLVGTLLFGGSYALFGFAGPQLWSWYAAAAVFAICGHACSQVVWTMAVVRRFKAGRGLALAASMSMSGAVVALIPIIVLSLVGSVGIRSTFFVLGAGAALLMFVPAFFFFKEAPGTTGAPGSRTPEAQLPGCSVAAALTGTRYWRLALALLIISTTVGMFIVHYQSMLIDSGLSPASAAKAALLLGPAMIVGRLGTGYLFDRLPASLVGGVAFAVPVACCVSMLSFQGDMTHAVLTAALIGLGLGAEVDVVAYMTSRHFGLKHYGLLFGILIGLYGAGVGAGSTLAGYVFDRTGNYDPLLIALAIGCALASLLVLTLGRPVDWSRASVGLREQAA